MPPPARSCCSATRWSSSPHHRRRRAGRGQLRHTDSGLEIDVSADSVALEIVTRIDPSANLTLSGLYQSRGGFFTQCEAEGFRRITYFPDRPT
jgi:aminopeptidase N